MRSRSSLIALITLTVWLSPAPAPAETACGGAVAWEQLPVEALGITSIDDRCSAFLSESADWFVGNGNDVGAVEWWGVFWSGSAKRPEGFRISFYTDGGGCPGLPIAELETHDFDVSSGPGGLGRYCATLTAPVPTVEGRRYYVSIVAILCYPPEWGWASAVLDEEVGCFRSALLGHPVWEAVISKRAFRLYDAGRSTPVERHTWGSIKAVHAHAPR